MGWNYLQKVMIAVVIGTASLVFSLSAVANEDRSSGPLDGMVFVGKIGDKGNADTDDELHFRDGTFWSAFCTKFGLQPGDYWVRKVGERIQFRGVLTGKPGTFVYRGEVSDGRAKVSVNWTKSRWYWTTERELEFVGRIRIKESASPQDAKRTLISAFPSEQKL